MNDFEQLWKDRPWWGEEAADKDRARYWYGLGLKDQRGPQWRTEDKWHEDMGPAIWCRIPVDEPYYAGCPRSDDWTEDYYTHFILMRDLPAAPVMGEGDAA